MSTRANFCFLCVGRKNTGKTTIALQIARATGKKIIVIDTDDHPSYSEFPIINVEDIPRWKSGNARIVSGEPESALIMLNKSQSNCFIICEDSAKYVSANIQQPVKAFIIDHRKRNFDILFMFHFLADVPPYLTKQYDKMILFKTADAFDVRQNKFPNWHTISKKLERILKHPSFNYCETIAVDE